LRGEFRRLLVVSQVLAGQFATRKRLSSKPFDFLKGSNTRGRIRGGEELRDGFSTLGRIINRPCSVKVVAFGSKLKDRDSWACVFRNLQILGGCFCFESNRHHTQGPRGAMVTFALLALAFAERIR
jgi:hypothetical protein